MLFGISFSVEHVAYRPNSWPPKVSREMGHSLTPPPPLCPFWSSDWHSWVHFLCYVKATLCAFYEPAAIKSALHTTQKTYTHSHTQLQTYAEYVYLCMCVFVCVGQHILIYVYFYIYW